MDDTDKLSPWLKRRGWRLHRDMFGHSHALRSDGTGVWPITASARRNTRWNAYHERTGRAVAGDFNTVVESITALAAAEQEGWYSCRWRDPLPPPHPRPGWRHRVTAGRDSWTLANRNADIVAEVRLLPPDRAQRRAIRVEDEAITSKWVDDEWVDGYFGIDHQKRRERLASEQTRPLFAVWVRGEFLCRVTDDPVPWRAAVNWDEVLLFDDAGEAMLAAEHELQRGNHNIFGVFDGACAATRDPEHEVITLDDYR